MNFNPIEKAKSIVLNLERIEGYPEINQRQYSEGKKIECYARHSHEK